MIIANEEGQPVTFTQGYLNQLGILYWRIVKTLIYYFHFMVVDSLFYLEKNWFRKISLLITIPCAILPMLMAVSGLMTAFSSPLFFKHDYLLFAAVYLVYASGLYFSWQAHKKIYPILIFLAHLAGVFIAIKEPNSAWLPYFAIITLILTSVVNQYYRVGSFECKDCADLLHFREKNKSVIDCKETAQS
ncbi:MAG TPA: MerC domain-containing protein [Puia sp.]|nr:MerC domain-containing protein [Puia sp.]